MPRESINIMPVAPVPTVMVSIGFWSDVIFTSSANLESFPDVSLPILKLLI